MTEKKVVAKGLPKPKPAIERVTHVNFTGVKRRTGYRRYAQFVDEAVVTCFEDTSVGIEAYYTVDGEHPVINDHFDGLMPGSLIVEMAAQAAYLGALQKGLVTPKRIRPVHYDCGLSCEVYPGDRLVAVVQMPAGIRVRRSKAKSRDGSERHINYFTQEVKVKVYLADQSWGGSRELVMEITIKAIAELTPEEEVKPGSSVG